VVSFKSQLTAVQIRNVAAYVATYAGAVTAQA
jgi:hypothetical protein